VGDFIIVPGEYERIPDLLLSEAPAFGTSDEFQSLQPDDLALPGVVLGAFRRYVQRVFSKRHDAVSSEQADALRALERLATSSDREVVNALVVEVFEHLDQPQQELNDLLDSLGPAARALYDRWLV
jgi:hypothetical protein